MENEVLLRNGLFLDEMTRKIRLMHTDYHQLTGDLVLECVEYLKGSKDFKTATEKQLSLLMKLKKITERQKMEVIGKRSQLHTIGLQKQVMRNKIYAELKGKEIKLARARQQHEALLLLKAEHAEAIQMLCRR